MHRGNGRSPTSNRILITDNQELLGAGLEKLLSNDKSLEVCGVPTQDETALIGEIWRLQPDTVILTIEAAVTSPARLLMLLQDYGRLRIILVSVDSNLLEIYDRQEVIAHNRISLLANLRPE